MSFGQSVGLNGDSLPNGEQRIYVYDVVGDVVGTSGASTVEEMLKELGATVAVVEGSIVKPAGLVEDYIPRWGASIEKTGASGSLYEGSILVVRHPRSGTINTLVTSETIEVNQRIKEANDDFGRGNSVSGKAIAGDILLPFLNGSNVNEKFGVAEVNFCVDPYGVEQRSDNRRNVRLVANARNSSGVEVIDLDSDKNECRRGA